MLCKGMVMNMPMDEKKAFEREDLSADELLKLLHKSVEKSSVAKPQTKKSHNADTTSLPEQLRIDDAVYKSAEEELKYSEAATRSDDSDLDVDALIAKYLTPKQSEEPQTVAVESAESAESGTESDDLRAEPLSADEIVREFTSPRQKMQEKPAATEVGAAKKISDEDDIEITIRRIDEANEPIQVFYEDSDASVVSIAEEADESVSMIAEEADEPVSMIDEVADETVRLFDDEADDDVKVFDEVSAEEMSAEAVAMDPVEDPEKTTEFDLNAIREMTAEAPAVDEAFEASATEVFTPVHEDEQEVLEASQTYGTVESEEIDQRDLDLMIAFGMEEELKETVGEAKARELEEDIQKKHEETLQMDAVKQVTEYTSRDQTEEIFAAFKGRYYTCIMRIMLSIVLLGAVFFLENHSLLGITLPSFMRPTSYPVVFAMIDLQLIVLAGALVYRQLIDGVKSLIALNPTAESMTAFAMILSVLYTAIACITAPADGFKLFNLPVAAAVSLALIYEFLNLKRNVFSFSVVSSKKKKFVVSPVSDSTESLEREMFRDYIPEDSQIIRVGKTDFVDGFFARIGDATISRPVIGIIIPIVMIASAAFVIFGFIKTQSVYQSITLAYMTAMLTLPTVSYMIYSFPFYRAAKQSYDNDSAIIGETSLQEYSGSAVISFEDKEVFPSGGVKVTSIKVYGSNRIDEIIYSLASAFIKVGGPLADVFSQATHDLGHSEDVDLISVEDDGFTAVIDDVEVFIGKASYMEKKDYDPPFDAEDKRIEQRTSLGILYVAFGGQLTAKVYVQYTIDSEFEAILAQLYKTGMCVGIKSFDPNIDDLMLAKKIKAMKYPVKVIRSKTPEDIPHATERSNSGIVSKRSVKMLLKTVALCERVSSVIKTNMIFKILAMLIGIAAMIFILFFGSALDIRSLHLTIYQLIWLIPVIVITLFSL